MLGLTGSLRDLQNARALDVAVVDGNGDQLTGFDSSRPASAAITSVASAATSTVLLPANPARRRVIFYNDSTKNLRVAFAATASATAFTALLPGKSLYESDLNDYTGIISGIWEAANGFARITEITT